jgi:phage host-nuclease inhibitor protein Gam
MHIRFLSLTLICTKKTERIDFSPQVSFFYGPTSAGKSIIGHLIDFCLGAKLKQVVALQREMLSAQLLCRIGEREICFERGFHQAQSVRVTWQDDSGKDPKSVDVPLEATSVPIYDKDVFCLSDLIFHFAGTSPMKVRKSKRDPDSPLVRLSFRDVMWYCYLIQEELDSSFFSMEDPYKRLKSIDAMKFIVGLHSEKLNELDIELATAQERRRTHIGAIAEIREFLNKFKLGSEMQIAEGMGEIKATLATKRGIRSQLQANHSQTTHIAEPLRERLRRLSERLGREQEAMKDLEERVRSQEELRAELIAAKIKSQRQEAASKIFSDVAYEMCPACGTALTKTSNCSCYLCKQDPQSTPSSSGVDLESFRTDINERIDELADSIKRHRAEYTAQRNRLGALTREKQDLDRQLSEELARYDSAYLSQVRAVDSEVARLEERLVGLDRLAGMPKAIERMEREVKKLELTIQHTKDAIDEEKAKIANVDKHVREIEEAFLQIMLDIHFPGVGCDDEVSIDRTTWCPYIIHSEQPTHDRPAQKIKWSFHETSGGKSVLFNICYALSVHLVASRNSLPLPRFLIIDGPTKNLSADVNDQLVRDYFRVIYHLCETELADTQFVLIDSDLTKPESAVIDFKERLMVPGSSENPPLISYYVGP